MSHFAVAVFHNEDQSVDELLAPYDEGIKYAPYLKFSKQDAINYVREKYREMLDKNDDDCWNLIASWYIPDRKGNLYSTSNPNAKWDWWVIGGRWSNLLKLKNGVFADSARVRDIDFTPNRKLYKNALRFWDIFVEHKPLEKDEEMPFSLHNEDYYRAFYKNRDTYARRQAQFSTFAVISANGIWEEKAESGWFGMSNETPQEAENWEDNFFDNFIKGNDDLFLTIVDCHI